MQKIILIPSDPNQKPIDLLINRYSIKKNHILLVFPGGDIKYLPKEQIKEWKVVEVDDDSHDRPARKAA